MRKTILPPFPKIAGTIKEFKDWDSKMKAEHPILFKLDAIVYRVTFNCIYVPKQRLSDVLYWFRYRLIPRHRHHVVAPRTVKPGYIDPREMLLHCNFHIFAEFMTYQLSDDCRVLWYYPELDEIEDSSTIEDYEHKVTRNATWNTMMELYNWWSIERPARSEQEYPDLPDEWGFLATLNEDYDNEPLMQQWCAVSAANQQLELEWDEQDQLMLHKLIDIRQYMWD
jgi:hypothetical protein